MPTNDNVIKFPNRKKVIDEIRENWMDRLAYERDVRAGKLSKVEIVTGEAILAMKQLHIANKYNL